MSSERRKRSRYEKIRQKDKVISGTRGRLDRMDVINLLNQVREADAALRQGLMQPAENNNVDPKSVKNY